MNRRVETVNKATRPCMLKWKSEHYLSLKIIKIVFIVPTFFLPEMPVGGHFVTL